MNTISTMRVGFTGFDFPGQPEGDPFARAVWVIEQAAALGCGCLHLGRLPNDPEKLDRLRDLLQEKDMELDLGAPGVFGLAGPEPDKARAELQDSIAAARRLGVRILRTGYGRLTVETSRFNKQMTVSEHLEKLAANLRLAAPLIEEAGLLLAIENHCDFTGREMAALFDIVTSPVVGCALDTANGFTVFCDPNEDVQVLAPYAFTTHIKDMVAFNYKVVPPQLPILFTGCALGQGHVDIPLAVRTLAEKSPCANGLHLIVELWPVPAPEGRDPLEVKRAAFVDSVAFLQQLIGEPAAAS